VPFSDNPYAKAPDDGNAQILRYVNLEKLMSLLANGALYFARSDQFTDAFEGSVTLANLRSREVTIQEEDATADEVAQREDIGRDLRCATFINCWAAGPESVAMWRLYSREENSVAIESSYAGLKSALGGERRVFVGTVAYADYRAESIPDNNLLAPFLYKRIGFAYEREVRAIVQDVAGVAVFERRPVPSLLGHLCSTEPLGISVPVDVRRLIARVRLSPVTQPWYREVVESVMAKYGYDLKVVQSDLAGEPVF
jgi:hypothetical protein